MPLSPDQIADNEAFLAKLLARRMEMISGTAQQSWTFGDRAGVNVTTSVATIEAEIRRLEKLLGKTESTLAGTAAVSGPGRFTPY